MNLKLFIDFDGTISQSDVGDVMFRELGGERCGELVLNYLDGRISARECLVGECEAAGAVILEVMNKIIDNQEIDPTFDDFVHFCKVHDIDFYVLSHGFDYYIERILKRFGIEEVKFFANHLEFRPVDGKGQFFLTPIFPYLDEECDRCANCKRNHLLTLSAEDDIIVYIGNGYSDRCPSRYADVVFAKMELLRYCRKENISCFEFGDFSDVKERLEKLLRQKQIRKRWQAELHRREAFLQG